jgi:hypothetical protein
MKYYVVSLLALFPLLTLQTPRALAHGFARGGHFASRRVIIINPSHARFVHHANFIVPRHQFVGNPVISLFSVFITASALQTKGLFSIICIGLTVWLLKPFPMRLFLMVLKCFSLGTNQQRQT